MGSTHKACLLHVEVQRFSAGYRHGIVWVASWTSQNLFFFFHETPYLLGRLSDGKLRSLSLSGRRSLRNEQPQPVASRKSIGNFYCRYYKVQSLKRKLRFWKTRICHWDLNSFPISKDFPDKLGGEIVNVIFFKITYHKMR